MKWLVVAAILTYVGLRVWVAVKPDSSIARAFRRRYVLRTDTQAMTRKELLLSSLSFLAFGLCGIGLYFGVDWGSTELHWRVFHARPVVVLGKAGLFVGAMALVACVFLLGAAIYDRKG
jgi:hypothetical protein